MSWKSQMTFDLCMTTASENTAKGRGSADEAIIFGVIADPEPQDSALNINPESAMTSRLGTTRTGQRALELAVLPPLAAVPRSAAEHSKLVGAARMTSSARNETAATSSLILDWLFGNCEACSSVEKRRARQALLEVYRRKRAASPEGAVYPVAKLPFRGGPGKKRLRREGAMLESVCRNSGSALLRERDWTPVSNFSRIRQHPAVSMEKNSRLFGISTGFKSRRGRQRLRSRYQSTRNPDLPAQI